VLFTEGEIKMIHMFGQGIGLTDEEIMEINKAKDLERLDELLIQLDLLNCEEEDE
jgi:hypothetical protein